MINLKDFYAWESQRVSPKTLELYKMHILNFFKMYGTDLSIITKQDIETFIRNGTHQSQGVKSSCVCRKSALKAFQKWLKREHSADWGNDIDEIDLPRPTHRLPSCLTSEEIKAIFKYARKPWELCMFQLLYSCGLRASELCSLKLKDINFENRELTVLGKGSKERKCFLGANIIKLLHEHIKNNPEMTPDDLLFTSPRKKIKLSDTGLGALLLTCAKKAGITRRVHPHMMRHSFATSLLKSGTDIMTIKEMMGHESISTTQVYLSVENKKRREAFEKTFSNFNDTEE